MPAVLFIQHDADNPAGIIADVFAQHGWTATVFHVVPRRDFPGSGVYDAIVALGSDYAVDDPEIAGWLGAEQRMLRAAHHAGVPVLGVCFGSQVLAMALGGLARKAIRPHV